MIKNLMFAIGSKNGFLFLHLKNYRLICVQVLKFYISFNYVLPSLIYKIVNQFRINRHGIYIKIYNDKYGETWKMIKIFGKPLKRIYINSDYDCTGQTFCNYVKIGLFYSIGYYGIDI